MQQESIKTFGIVSRISWTAAVQAYNLSIKTAALSENGEPLLDPSMGMNRIPHISHFHCVGPETRVVAALRGIAESIGQRFGMAPFPLFEVKLTGNWLFWEPSGELDQRLIGMHWDIMRRWESVYKEFGLKPVPLGWTPPESMQASIERFGYPNCGSSWKPHVTLNVLDQAHVGMTFEPVGLDATLPSLMVVEIGDRGVTERCIGEYPLVG